jgi:hypothetical protein
MKANPEKFQAIAIGKQTKQQNLTFTIDGNKIECESEVKLLGVTIQLNFNEHVSNICKKASRQLNVLKRIGTQLTKLGKLTIYYSFIMSNFNYFPLVLVLLWRNEYQKNRKKYRKGLRDLYTMNTPLVMKTCYANLNCHS